MDILNQGLLHGGPNVVFGSPVKAFSSPEPTILLACGMNRELWEQPFWNIKGNNRILPIRFHVVGIYGVCLKWLLPELSIPAAGQKDCRLWGRECREGVSDLKYPIMHKHYIRSKIYVPLFMCGPVSFVSHLEGIWIWRKGGLHFK